MNDILGNKPLNYWDVVEQEEVEINIKKTGYPADKIKFIKGPVEKTLLSKVPQKIALLRLDTDWYESTKIELEVLYPKLVSGGILIIDDYGSHKGCKVAVDEFFRSLDKIPFMHRIDYSGRLIIKP